MDPSVFECVYSPAKRRGPVPGRAGQARKASDAFSARSNANIGMEQDMFQGMGAAPPTTMEELQLRQMMMHNLGGPTAMHSQNPLLDPAAAVAGSGFLDSQQAAIQQQLNLIQQLQAQQGMPTGGMPNGGGGGGVSNNMTMGGQERDGTEQPAQRMKTDPKPSDRENGGVPRTIASHTHLLELSDPDGSRLRSYYRLSVDELFGFPPTPTDEEYCIKLNIPGMTPRMIPGTHLAALSAARFAEVALGAIVHNEVSLAMELCNAVVHCLRESVQDPVQPPYMFEVARSYFLLGVFRAFRGDMVRYFKYRRVCLTYASKLDVSASIPYFVVVAVLIYDSELFFSLLTILLFPPDPFPHILFYQDDSNASILLAAVSFLDAWAYMIYNADEKKLPQIDDSIPPVERPNLQGGPSQTELEYNTKLNPACVASDPKNQNWIQGAPPVYLNNEAPLPARSLDALACAVRTCCDQANGRFAAISKEAKEESGSEETAMEDIPQDTIITPTTTAVVAHENELCSRNMVLSAFTLLQQHEAATSSTHKNQGIHLVISAMDAFLDNGDEDETGGFTDSQIQSLLSVCNTTIENPFLLHHGGPTYHMVSNAAVMLCHLLNGMYAMKGADGVRKSGDMEAAMFEEVLDTFIAVRKLLVIHRRKLPVKLRCHGIPRPSLGLPEEGKPFIDLGETLLCACRGCQGFVLMACSPCVAAERARSAALKRKVEAAREAEVDATDPIDKELDDLSNDFNLDDDALLGMLSQLIST